MKEEILFVNVGQAGGNVGSLFEAKNYDNFYINSSIEDLNTLRAAKHTFHLKGGEGCNKDFDKALELLGRNIDPIHEQIDALGKDKSMIGFEFSIGGGTGAGATPDLIESYIEDYNKKYNDAWDKYEDALDAGEDVEPPKIKEKIFFAVTMMPSLKEQLKPHLNAYKCLNKLFDIEGLGAIFIIDNDNSKDIMAANREFVELFDTYINIPNTSSSLRGNVDRAEIKQTLRTPGYAILSSAMKEGCTQAILINSLKRNIFAEIESDKIIQYLSASTTIPLDIDEFSKEFGVMVDTYLTHNDRKNIIGAFGLSFPKTRIELIEEKVNEDRSAVTRSIQNSGRNVINKDLDFLGNIKREPKKKRQTTTRTVTTSAQNDDVAVTEEIVVEEKTSAKDQLKRIRRRS